MRKKYKKMEDIYSDESDPDYTNFNSDSINSDSDYMDLDGDTNNASDSDTDSSSDDEIVIKKKVKKAKLSIDNTKSVINKKVEKVKLSIDNKKSVINKKVKKAKPNIDSTILNNDVDSGSVTQNVINNKAEPVKSNVDNTNLNSDRDSGRVEENVKNNKVEQAKSNTNDTNLDNDVDSDSDNSNSDVDDDDSGGEIEVNYSEEQIKSIIIPVKSKILYEQQYDRFKNFCLQREVTKIDKKVILDYFEDLSKNMKGNTLWSRYSRLKPMLLMKESVDISKHKELLCFLREKLKNEPHTVETRVFTKKEISKFLKTAPDDEYLLHKVALNIGLYGCLRVTQLTNMKTTDIKEQDGLYRVAIPTTETNREKSFVLNEEASGIISKYVKLRPEGMERFFLQIRNNKCTRQNVGKHTFSSVPKEIAKYLNLSDPELYTGHTFRRTGVTLLADGEAETLSSKKHNESESNTDEEEDINQPIKNKTNTIRLTKKSITPTSDMDLVIPDKSKILYTKQYIKYRYWRVKKKAPETNEILILDYFKELSKKFQATSLWSIYSKLRSMILLKESIDISTYLKLQRFLKKKKEKHTPIKSKSFTKEEISTFLKTAPDEKFLLHKVVLIIGLYGCLRQEEIIKMEINNIKQEGNLCHVSLPDTKTNKEKSFIINEEGSAMIIKYMKLRPEGMTRFFQLFQNNRCTRQNLGKGKITCIARDIAKFLNLSDPKLYRGHSFIRSSTILLANRPDKEADKPHEEADKPDKEADIPDLEKRGECQNNTVAQDDVNESIQNEINTSSLISNSTNSMDTEEPEISTNSTLLMSTTTKSLYEQQYGKFKDWCKQWKAKEINEKILLTYFRTLSLSFKATTLLAVYCRLKPMLLSKESIDISKYPELQSFIKEKTEQHTVKTTKVFTKEEISKFLKTASDNEFLLHKVVLIISLYGHFRKVDLVKMNADSIKQQGNLYQILIPAKKRSQRKAILKHKRKSENITEESIILNEEASEIISKYVKLRPEGIKRFFLQIRNNKCTRQGVGKHTFSSIPKEIAKFLNLSDPELYTGHAFIRSSTMLKDDKSDEETDKPDEETDDLDEEADKPDEEADMPALEKNSELNHFSMGGTMQSHFNQNQWVPAAQYNNEGVVNNYNYNTYNYNNYNYQENLPSSIYGAMFPGSTQ